MIREQILNLQRNLIFPAKRFRNAKILIYSLDGKLILDKKLNSNSNQIYVNQKGIYIMKTILNTKNYSKKIIVN